MHTQNCRRHLEKCHRLSKDQNTQIHSVDKTEDYELETDTHTDQSTADINIWVISIYSLDNGPILFRLPVFPSLFAVHKI